MLLKMTLEGEPEMRTKQAACALVTALAFTAAPAFAEEHRQLGAHVHGHGRLNIAVEGKTVSMELEVPGADIVGFEHEPSTAEQRDAIGEAKAKLANGLALFVLPEKAGCELQEVKVSIEGGHEEDHDEDKHGAASGHEHEEDEHDHSEFHVTYSLGCTSPSRLTSMTFEYFKAFSGAQELDVSVVTPKGQASHEVKRDNPSLNLEGDM
jgi:hypothetical protein